MEPQLSSTRWCPTKAGGKKENNKKGMHTVKETDMVAAKMDLLLKRPDERATDKEALKGTIQAMDSYMTCVVCG
jgi:3-deoxy-D-manno-octulosonic-acid transferase